MTPWFLYLIRTADNKLYTGITTDVERRYQQHQSGKGVKALRGKGELTLAFSAILSPPLTAMFTMPAVKAVLSNFMRHSMRTMAGEKPLGGAKRGMMTPLAGSRPTLSQASR